MQERMCFVALCCDRVHQRRVSDPNPKVGSVKASNATAADTHDTVADEDTQAHMCVQKLWAQLRVYTNTRGKALHVVQECVPM